MTTNKSILIIAVARTGSTSLAESFHKSFKIFQEPLNHKITTNKKEIPWDEKKWIELIKTKNIVVKSAPFAKPIDVEYTETPYLETSLDYFDHIILLDRKDDNLQKESWERLIEYDKDNPPKIEWMDKSKFYLKEISKKYNLKIHYYEDIFYGDSEKFLNEIGIDASLVDLRYLDSKYKYEEGNIFQNKELEKLIKSNQYTM
jgi:hypothetical protein